MFYFIHLQVFTSDDDLYDVSDTEDTADEPANFQLPIATIEGIFDVDPYLACPKKSCNNTKLITIKEDIYLMYCKNCNGKFRASDANHYLRATILLATDAGSQKVAIFAPQMRKLFQSRGLEFVISFDAESA